MNHLLMAELLTSDSDEITELRNNASIIENFIDLTQKIDASPDISKRFYEESRSLYQATSTGRDIKDLEKLLTGFFGPPVKNSGEPLARKLKKNSSVKYLGGLQKEQSLFLMPLKTGEFYGALWPWRRNKNKIEIHLGYCSDWITDEDYDQLDTFVTRCLSQSAFQKMDTAVGGRIHGISLPSFLQMAEMEHSSFTLRITAGEKVGRLFVLKGTLINAQTDSLTGRQAAYSIISWDDVAIEIAPVEDDKVDEIKQPLMHVLMESLKIKDERTAAGDQPAAPKPRRRPTKTEAAASKRLVRLERAPTPQMPGQKRSLTKILAALLALVIIGTGALVVVNHLQSKKTREIDFKKMLANVEDTESPQEKLTVLENFLNKHPGTLYSDRINSLIAEVRHSLEEREFEQITLQISKLKIDETYEKKAIALYSDFLAKYPDSHLTERINKAIADIKDLIDQYYYEELKQAARLNFKERLQTYKDYLARFPEGKYNKDVSTLIEQMGSQYFDYLKSEAVQCEKNKNWTPCLEHCNAFLESYSGSSGIIADARKLKAELGDKQDLNNLRRAAAEAGIDYQKAYSEYKNYLAHHPKTTQRSAIEAEMKTLESQLKGQKTWLEARAYATDPAQSLARRIRHLDKYIQDNLSGPYSSKAQELIEQLEREQQSTQRQRQITARQKEEQARIQREQEKKAALEKRARELTAQLEATISGSQRYRNNGNGSFTDLVSGQTWTLMDSFQALGGCLNYQDALTYINGLQLGGHSDWRMPTPSELAAILKRQPFFPSNGADWYWSSESYVKGYHTVADIVTSKPETIFTRQFRDVNECGSVRAVRP